MWVDTKVSCFRSHCPCRSGVAAIGERLILSVSKCCRLSQIAGRMKVSLNRCPIPNAKLYQCHGVPLLVTEGKNGDICVLNHSTGQVLAMLDNRHGPSFNLYSRFQQRLFLFRPSGSTYNIFGGSLTLFVTLLFFDNPSLAGALESWQYRVHLGQYQTIHSAWNPISNYNSNICLCRWDNSICTPWLY
jgi:hypothetical protein